MKNILVTGANGFIGQALVQALEDKGFNVYKFNSSDGDISDFDFQNIYANIELEHIFHLASKTFVPDSWNNPIEFYKTAVVGTNNILELCRMKGASLTYISAYLYGQPEKLPISEDEKIKSNNPYAHSKHLAEQLCKFYSDFYDIKVTIARPFNIYGKKQKEMFLIPHIIKQVLNDEYIQVKDLNPKRDYIYLTDLINGLLSTLNSKQQFSIFNFGSGKELSVKEVIDTIQKLAKTNKIVISEEIERRDEVMSVIADIAKANNLLEWKPLFSFEEGIKEILKDMKDE